jgi:hypothetical protein
MSAMKRMFRGVGFGVVAGALPYMLARPQGPSALQVTSALVQQHLDRPSVPRHSGPTSALKRRLHFALAPSENNAPGAPTT